MNILKEACVGSFSEAKRAQELGAHRIELCDNLMEGGTTPSLGTIQMAKKTLNVPVYPIIRPRGGNFVFSEEEVQIMELDIQVCKSLGVEGVVIGALTPHNQIDVNTIKRLVTKAQGMNITIHMAFDFIEDKKVALDKLIELGVHRVLTKGGEKSAMDNLETLKNLTQYARDRIIILAGGGVTQGNYMDLVSKTGIKEVHGTRIVGDLKT